MTIEKQEAQLRVLMQGLAPEDAAKVADGLVPFYLDRAFAGPRQVADTPGNRQALAPKVRDLVRRALESLAGTPAGLDQIHAAVLAQAKIQALGLSHA